MARIDNAHLRFLADWRDNRPHELPTWAHSMIHILEVLMSDQDTLNAANVAFNVALDAIETDVADLKAAAAAVELDFSALDATLARAQAIVPPVVVPAPAPVDVVPAAPVDPNAPVVVDPNAPVA